MLGTVAIIFLYVSSCWTFRGRTLGLVVGLTLDIGVRINTGWTLGLGSGLGYRRWTLGLG